MSLALTYDAALSRVRLHATALTPGEETATFERSRNQITWTTVRGGAAVDVSSGEARIDDYEFLPGVTNHYRVTTGVDSYSATITPAPEAVWLKSIARPFLNRPVKVQDYSAIERRSRNGIFNVVGRSLPVVVTDVRPSRQWTMELYTDDLDEARALDLVFASGDPLYVQVPPEFDVPSGYVVVGDVTQSKFGHASPRRYFSLPCVEVAAPGPAVVGATVTCSAIVATVPTCADLVATFPTCADVLEYVADPEVVIVP